MGIFSRRSTSDKVTALAGTNEVLIVNRKNEVIAVYDRNKQYLKVLVFASADERMEWEVLAKTHDWGIKL